MVPPNLVAGHSKAMCSIACSGALHLPHVGLAMTPHWFRDLLHTPWPTRILFKLHHPRRVRQKPFGLVVRLATSPEFLISGFHSPLQCSSVVKFVRSVAVTVGGCLDFRRRRCWFSSSISLFIGRVGFC